MRVKTEPSLTKVESKLSKKDLTKEQYIDGIRTIKEEGYSVKNILITRSAKPSFGMQIPLKLVADWDPQLEGADMIILLRKDDGHTS